MKRFIVLRCRRCRKIGVGHTQKPLDYRYKCKVCHKTTKLKKKEYGFNMKIFGSFDTGTEAEKFLKKLMEEIHKGEPVKYKTYEI